jgi:hypothetical protein
MRIDAIAFAAAPFASGEPTVMAVDDCTGGLHDGNASGGPCVRFGAAQALYAGTMDAAIGVAPLGRGCAAFATCATTIVPTIAMTAAMGRAIFLIFINAPPYP